MKNIPNEEINLLNLDIRFEDFCSGLARIIFIGSIMSMILVCSFLTGNESLEKQNGTDSMINSISPFRPIGPGGSGGTSSYCSRTTYYGGLSFSYCIYAHPLYSLIGNYVIEHLRLEVSQQVLVSRANGFQSFYVLPAKNSTEIGVCPNIFLYCKPYSYGVFKETRGIVHDPVSLSCQGCEFTWSPSFSVSQSFLGTPTVTTNFLLQVIIQHDGGHVKIYEWESLNGKMGIDWAEVVMGIISIPVPS